MQLTRSYVCTNRLSAFAMYSCRYLVYAQVSVSASRTQKEALARTPRHKTKLHALLLNHIPMPQL